MKEDFHNRDLKLVKFFYNNLDADLLRNEIENIRE